MTRSLKERVARAERILRADLERKLESGEWVPVSGYLGARASADGYRPDSDGLACALGGYLFGRHGNWRKELGMDWATSQVFARGFDGFEPPSTWCGDASLIDWYELGARLRADYLTCDK